MKAPSILVVTNYRDVHADKVLDCLDAMGVSVVRWHPDELRIRHTVYAADGELRINIPDAAVQLKPATITSAWYRKPAHSDLGQQRSPHERVAEIESRAIEVALYAVLRRAVWYSHPRAIEAASSKLGQLAYMKTLGLNIPAYCAAIVRSDVLAFCRRHGQVVIKPLDSRSQVAVGIEPQNPHFTRLDVRSFSADEVEAGLLCERLSHPIFVQSTVAKAFDARVTVIGNDVFAVAIHPPPSGRLDWRPETHLCEHEVVDLPEQVRPALYRFMVDHELNYSAFDFAVDRSGTWWFLECNPNGAFAWIEDKCKLPLSRSMAECLALKRPSLVPRRAANVPKGGVTHAMYP